ncbi:MAG: hypothetical protein ACMG57_00730 [Candidatus Dojkabacteria bacterium]
MRFKSLRNVLASVAAMFVVVALVSTQSVSAILIDTHTPNLVIDTFSSLSYPTDPSQPGYWWVTLGSSFDPSLRKENIECGNGVNNDSTCATIMSEGPFGLNKFVRMRLRAGEQPGQFAFSQLSEERDAKSYNLTHRWLPTAGHPVVLNVKSRYSANAKADGSGGAKGTIGVALWNSPTEQLDAPPYFSIHPAKTIALNWADPGVAFGTYTGYKAVIIDSDTVEGSFTPTYLQQIQDVNINQWFLQTIVWSVNSNGVQNVKFYIDGALKAESTLARPLPAMSVVMWADNNQVTAAPATITGDQYHDVSFTSISKL